MKAFLLLVITCFASRLFSQQLPPFKSLRFDEDYSILATDTAPDWYRKIKLHRFAATSPAYLSAGGELRSQYFYNKNEGWGDAPEDNNGYVLMRMLAHADFKAAKFFRVFLQLQSSLAFSRIDPGPVEQNPLDLHQSFVDINITSKVPITARIGRQEMQYGSQRLVSVREGPNNRQSFDGLRLMATAKKVRADLFYSHYVIARRGVFDDALGDGIKFWGIYNVLREIRLIGNIDLYYLGIDKRIAVYDDGVGSELRHSIGTRLWSKAGNWEYDFETVYQFGKFADKRVSAWTASVNAGYTITSLACKPVIGLKAELISGDKHYDDKLLQTFNPLFPRGAYFGLAALIGPSNLVDVHPSLSIAATPRLEVGADYDVFWRYSANDGLYAVNVLLIYPGKGITDKYIGQQLSVNAAYEVNHFINLTLECTWFDAGTFLKAAGSGKDILFAGFTAQCRF